MSAPALEAALEAARLRLELALRRRARTTAGPADSQERKAAQIERFRAAVQRLEALLADAEALELERETTATGHVIGAVYRSFYWGGTYRVIGRAGEWGVEVECVTPGSGAHQTVGARWTHATRLDPRDTEVQGG